MHKLSKIFSTKFSLYISIYLLVELHQKFPDSTAFAIYFRVPVWAPETNCNKDCSVPLLRGLFDVLQLINTIIQLPTPEKDMYIHPTFF